MKLKYNCPMCGNDVMLAGNNYHGYYGVCVGRRHTIRLPGTKAEAQAYWRLWWAVETLRGGLSD